MTEQRMLLVIICDCGVKIQGDMVIELLSNARNHIDEAHPEQVGKVSDDELLSSAEKVPAPF